MTQLIIFGILSLLVIYISRRNLLHMNSHGFYRFFSWICISWLFSDNYSYWFENPFSLPQMVSWGLLLIAVYLVITGGIRLIRSGKPSNTRKDDTLFSFEKTTGLIDTGVYKYIRHPLYASLIYLSWGICLKNPSIINIIIACISTIFLFLTSVKDEKECIAYFGESYKSYMKRSRMFVPFIF